MHTADWFILSAMLPLGFLLGVFYFKGLWTTLNRLPTATGFGGRMIASFMIRLCLLILSFYLLMGNDWKRLIALTIGFWFSRLVMIRRYGSHIPTKNCGQSS
ncbi:MAG: ATP synthase subunit I [Pseudomonadota bacterium]